MSSRSKQTFVAHRWPRFLPRLGLGGFLLLTPAGCDPAPASVDSTCEDATLVVEQCDLETGENPFGACGEAQRAQAQDLVDLYDDEGCAGLQGENKADDFFCETFGFLCDENRLDELADFTTDGCSSFPDGTLEQPALWQHCCIIHDYAYFAGGPSEAREQADAELGQCVGEAAWPSMGRLMEAGVRVGGTPIVDTPWRWGYGFSYSLTDGYRELSDEEEVAVAEKVRVYQANPTTPEGFDERVARAHAFIDLVPGLRDRINEILEAIEAGEE